jgi:hypothetical protein
MTHRRTTTAPRMEEAASLQIAGQLPGAVRELPLPNGTIADLAAPYWIAEIEPTRRWQHGLAQILEYWDQALRSPRPLLILIRDGTNTASRQHRRIERIAHSVGASVWTWDPHTGRFLTGGPAALPTQPDFSPLLTWTAQPWTPDEPALRSCHTPREPYATWRLIYAARNAARRPFQTH